MRYISLARFHVLVLGMILMFSNCKKKDEVAPAPTDKDAVFSYTLDKENPNLVNFKNNSPLPAWYVYWNMGASGFAEGGETSKFFPKKGIYPVRMKIFTAGGTAESTQNVTIAADFKGKNLLKGGDMNTGDDVNWKILSISNGVNWTFNNGSATASGGSGGHKGIYQAITVEAGKRYKFDARVFGSGATDTWFEAYINEKVPVEGQDYSGVPLALALNTWNGCGKTAFDDKLSVLSCGGAGNEMQFSKSGTVYLVIKTGGSNLGTTGISITNIEFYAIN